MAGKLKYRYQYMDAGQTTLFRYDNAPHHREIGTFPHHKHASDEVRESAEPTLRDILLEISRLERGKSVKARR